MTRPTPDIDDDKPTTKQPRASSSNAADVALLKDLLLWARKNHISIPQVRIGAVALVARDLNPRSGGRGDPAPSDIYDEFGLGDPDEPR